MEYFEKEISLIESSDIKNIVRQGLALVPSYFYHVPASSSGKYHPNYALGDGGLYRHVQAFVIVAVELLRLNMFAFSQREKDIIIASAILHDCWKQGLEGGDHTVFDHPRIAAEVLRKNIVIDPASNAVPALNEICNNIESHMGQWNEDTHGIPPLPPLPLPVSAMQKFVHLCDYIASRRQLEVTFT